MAKKTAVGGAGEDDAGKRRRAQRVYQDPIKYEIGRDLTPAQYEELMVKVGEWFAEWRDTDSPVADARLRIKACLEGRKLDGQPWFSHWNSSFATRMRMLCRFDVDKMQPIRTGDEKRKAQKERAKQRETDRRQASLGRNDPHIPEIRRQELPGNIAYGDLAKPITELEQKLWTEYRDAYLQQFPELQSVNARGELSMLCDLHVVHERNRLKLLKGDRIDSSVLTDTTKNIAELKKALGIHPDQLAKRVEKDKIASVAEAAARFEAMPKALQDKFFLEELLLLYQMFMTPSPRDDMGGYQLDEIGLFGHTRCRTCHCAKCGTKNYVGIAIGEIESYLIEKGVLEALENPVEVFLAGAGTAPTEASGGVGEEVEGGASEGHADTEGPAGTDTPGAATD